MKERWRSLVAFLNAPEDPLSLALVRVFACTTVALHFGRFFLSGAADFALVHQEHGGMSTTHGWLEPLGGAEPSLIMALGACCCIAAICGALGLFTRPALVVTWLTVRTLSSLNDEAKGSYDGLFIDTLFVLMLSGAGRTFSLDAPLFPEREGLAPRWPRVLLVAQIGLLYLGSALNKGSLGWLPGGDASALFYILQQPTWARFPEVPLWSYPLTQVATTMVWLFEITGLLFALAVLLRETKPKARVLSAMKRWLDRIRFVELYLAFGFAMHVGIELSMEVGPFCFASLALYPAAIAPERLRATWARLAPRPLGAR